MLLVGFLVFERVGFCLWCCRFECVNMSSILKNNGFDSSYFFEVIVDKDIMLYGVVLFGNKNVDYLVILNFLNNEDVIFMVDKIGLFIFFYVKLEKDYFFYYGFDVLFDYSVLMKKDVKYCIKVVIVGFNFCVEG